MELVDTLDLGSSAERCESSSLSESTIIQDRVAQQVEQMTVNHWVVGSNPTVIAKQFL